MSFTPQKLSNLLSLMRPGVDLGHHYKMLDGAQLVIRTQQTLYSTFHISLWELFPDCLHPISLEVDQN